MTKLAPRDADATVVRDLRARIGGMQDGLPRVPIATDPALAALISLRTGGAYEVDSATLALALLAAPTRAGSWAAVIGAGDLGIEAAAEMGVDLSRMVLVPEPGEHWLEATAALIEVATVVVLRPPARVPAGTASRVTARLRRRSAALISWGRWPGSEASLSIESSAWSGARRGHGRLSGRRIVVAAARGGAPPRRAVVEIGESGAMSAGGPAREGVGAVAAADLEVG